MTQTVSFLTIRSPLTTDVVLCECTNSVGLFWFLSLSWGVKLSKQRSYTVLCSQQLIKFMDHEFNSNCVQTVVIMVVLAKEKKDALCWRRCQRALIEVSQIPHTERPYFAGSREWVCFHTFWVYCPTLVKFLMWGLHKELLSISVFWSNQYRKGRSIVIGLKEITFAFAP